MRGLESNITLCLFVFMFLIALTSFFSAESAKDISIDYDEEVEVGEEFTVTIKLIEFPEDEYDVKIDVIGGGSRIARILNDGQWKSTYYYVNDAITDIEDEKEFTLKVEEYIGRADIEVKIRNSAESAFSFTGYEIEVIESQSSEEDDEGDEDDDTSEDEEDDSDKGKEEDDNLDDSEDSDSREDNNIVKDEAVSLSTNSGNNNVEVIKLNAKDIKSNDVSSGVEEQSKENNNKKTALYSLGLFLVLIVFLFVLRKIISTKKHGLE